MNRCYTICNTPIIYTYILYMYMRVFMSLIIVRIKAFLEQQRSCWPATRQCMIVSLYFLYFIILSPCCVMSGGVYLLPLRSTDLPRASFLTELPGKKSVAARPPV